MNKRDEKRLVKMCNKLISCDKRDLAIWLAWYMCSTELERFAEVRQMKSIINAKLEERT